MIPVHVTAPEGAEGPDGSMANLNSHSKSVAQDTGLHVSGRVLLVLQLTVAAPHRCITDDPKT